MKRMLTFATLALLAASPAMAQRAAATPDSVVKKLTGTWDGTFFSDQAGENPMKMIVAHDSTWHGTMTMTTPHGTPTMQLEDLKVNGNALAWTAKAMDAPCTGKATVIAGALKGELTCPFGTMGFLLHRK